MDNYLEQFKRLPGELQAAISSDDKIRQLEEIEKKYNLKLTKLVVRVMIKDIAWSELEKFLQENFHLSPERAAELKKDLAEKIFNEAINYLEKPTYEIRKDYENTKTEKTATTEAQKIEAGIKNNELGIKKPAFVETTAGEAEIDYKKLFQETKSVLTTMTPPASLALLDLGKIIREIKQKLNLIFEDEVLEHRFESIIRSYFREVRNEVQTEETLRRAKKIGGLEFLPEKAALVARVIKEYKNKIELGIKNNELGIKQEKIKSNIPPVAVKYISPGSEIDRNLSRPDVETKPTETPPSLAAKPTEIAKPKAEEIKPVDRELQKRFESGPILPAFKKISEPLKVDNRQPQKTVTTETQKPSFAAPSPKRLWRVGDKATEGKQAEPKRISIQIKQPISGEKLVEDINQGVRRAIGPVEELAEITPLDLQRWGGGENTTQIILDKINLLQEISLLKRAEGIQAWQRSSLAKLYLEIGREALEKRKSILQTIQERKNEGSPFLKIEDFEAINELNRKLRF